MATRIGDTYYFTLDEINRGGGGGGGSDDAVLYTPQTLSPSEQSQARQNIGAGTYTKPQTGIPSSDLESGVIPADVVKYSSQSLTDAQKTQARTNIGAGTYDKPSGGIPATDLASGVIPAPEIFWATYGTTTASEIDAAVTAGKAVMCRYSGKDYALVYYESTGTYCYLGALYSTNAAWLRVQRSNNNWTAGLQGLEQAGNKVSTIVGNEADTSKFPNCKAVYDYLDGLAETWTFTLANGTSVSKRIIVLPEEEA